MQSIETPPAGASGFLQSRLFARILMAGSGLLLVALTVYKIRDGLYFDDTFMFVRYARNILDFGNYGWNPGEHTYGCTNIPFTFWVVLLKALRIDALLGLSSCLLLSSLFWALLSLVLLHRLLNDLIGDRLGANRWLMNLYIASLAATPVFAYNIITGMDTTFSLFFVVVMLHFLLRFAARPEYRKNLFGAAFFSYFIFLLRPDCGLYAVLVPGLLFLDKRLRPRQIVSFYALLILLFAADTGVKYLYFGNPLPLPFFVKKSGFYVGYLGLSQWNAVAYTFDFLFNFGFLFIIFLLVSTPAALKKFMVFGGPLFLSLAYYFTVNQIMGFHSRYYLPSMPFFVVGTVYGISAITDFRLSLRKAVLPVAFALFLLLLQLITPVYELHLSQKSMAESLPFAMPRDTAAAPVSWRALDYKGAVQAIDKVFKLLPANATVAATEYGWLSVYTPDLRYLDLCGLHNEDMALHGYNDRFLATWMPAVIWMPPGDYTSLRKEMLTGPYFRANYDYFPDAINFGVAINKKAPNHDELVRRLIQWNRE